MKRNKTIGMHILIRITNKTLKSLNQFLKNSKNSTKIISFTSHNDFTMDSVFVMVLWSVKVT